MSEIRELHIPRPDDWHVHLRDGAVLAAVAEHTAKDFARALIMPNLVPPVVRFDDALSYRERIKAALPGHGDFEPLMTLYLTEGTDPDDVQRAAESGIVHALKLYPAGATTNSASGVRSIDAVMPVLERMAEISLPLCVHGEVTAPEIDIFDREAVFIEKVLDPLRRRIPSLKVVLEHVTTADAVDYVLAAKGPMAATITTHHLIINRNHMLVGGMRPHYYCLPVAKRERHRLALRAAAVSGDPRFFLGTDSAPHLDADKESACGCAGVFNTVNAISCLAQVFDDEQRLEALEAFACVNGPRFYGLPVNEQRVTLVKQDEPVTFPASLACGDDRLTVFDPGFPLYWALHGN